MRPWRGTRHGMASLATRIFATLLAISVGSAAVATVASALLHQRVIMNAARVELDNECDMVASALDGAADEVAELASIDLGEVRATLVSPLGEVLFDSEADTGKADGHVADSGEGGASVEGDGSPVRAADAPGNMSLSQTRVLASGNAIRLTVDRAGISAILMDDLGILATLLAVLVVVSYAASRFLASWLVSPIIGIDDASLAQRTPYEELRPLTDRLDEQQRALVEQMEELRNADAARREFTANVTHELKTPISSIMGASELLRDGFVLDEDIPGFAARINDEAQRLAALVNDILTLSRLDESERFRSQETFGAVEPVDLLVLARDVRERLSGRADHLEVTITVEGTSTVVSGFPHMLDELVGNLCSNAVRYNRPGGSVRIWVGMRDGRPTLEVTDTGIGIPQEAQAKVFERFFRVEASRSRESGGTGLGLAIVKHAATLHGATVSLESELGEGTTVTVSFSG